MIGLGFLLALILYVGLALFIGLFIRKRFKTPKAQSIAQVLTLLIFLLIPTWDIIPGKIYFNHLCKTEGGVKIYRTVEGVEGFMSDAIGSGSAKHFLNSIGYRYIEGKELNQFYRYSLSATGVLSEQEIDQPISRYSLTRATSQLPLQVKAQEEVIVDKNSREKLAIKKQFYRSGNWLQVKVSPFLGGGDYCPQAQSTSAELLAKTLRPIKPSKEKGNNK